MTDKNMALAASGTGLSQAEPVPVSSVPASIPSAMIRKIREKAKEFEYASKAKRREARDLELRAGEMFDAFISFDLLADKLEAELASAIEARRAETAQTGSVHESAVRDSADAEPSSGPSK